MSQWGGFMFKLSNLLLTTFSIVFISTFIFSDCMFVSENYSTLDVCENGDIASTGDIGWCVYDINVVEGTKKSVVIEMVSGGRYDNGRSQFINYQNNGLLWVWIDRETTPLYLSCYDTNLSNSDASSSWDKEKVLQTIAIGRNSLGFDEAMPEDTLFSDINISRYYSHKTAESDNILKSIGIILIIIGGIFGIVEVFNMWR